MSPSPSPITPSRAPAAGPASAGERCSRRLVLLGGGEDSAAEAVLAEYHGKEIADSRLHADLQRFAQEHRGRLVAAEWSGPRGWIRFLWCREDATANPT